MHKYKELTVPTSNLNTNVQYREEEHGEMRERRSRYIVFLPGDVKETVITGLALPLINL